MTLENIDVWMDGMQQLEWHRRGQRRRSTPGKGGLPDMTAQTGRGETVEMWTAKVWTDYLQTHGITPEQLLRAALDAFLASRGKELDTSGAGELVIRCKGGEDLNVPAIFLTL